MQQSLAEELPEGFLSTHRIATTTAHPWLHCLDCGMLAEAASTWPVACDKTPDGRRNQWAFVRWDDLQKAR